MDKYIEELKELLRIPSVSAKAEHKPDMARAAEWLQKKLTSLDFSAQVMPTSFHPVVYAENLTAGADKQTVMIYGHYDVQDQGDLSEWSSKPFEPEIRSGNIYARGTADDKGQLFTWIAAMEELKRGGHKLPVNVKFLIEGAEEEGSRGLSEFVEDNRSLLACDVVLISDSHSLSETQPVITYGLRGLAYMEVRLKALSTDVHSGIYGGNVMNPAVVLAQLIAKMKDEQGRVLIPGFYDQVRKIEKEEMEILDQYPFTAEDVMKETGAKVVSGEKGFSIPVRAGARPTLDVNGIWGGYQGEGAKTAIPGSVGAKISMRLVPHQTAADIEAKFTEFVRANIPAGIEVEITKLAGSEPVLFERKGKWFAAAEKALLKTFGNKPVFELSGGSIGVTVDFKRILGVDSLLLGYGLPDDNLHGPNEKLSLSMFEKGVKTNMEFVGLLRD